VAIAEQLESAKRNFEVGTATITDSQEAQSRFDLATAQEIAAQNDLDVKRQVLRTIVGKEPGRPEGRQARRAPRGSAAGRHQQVGGDGRNLRRSRCRRPRPGTKLPCARWRSQRAGHYPTLDLVASRGREFHRQHGRRRRRRRRQGQRHRFDHRSACS
jgi:outer membrane protein